MAEEIYPSIEGARTTYMQEKMSPEQCKWCTDLALAPSRGRISPSVPIPTQRSKACCYQSACPRASLQPPNCYSLLFQDAITQIALWFQNKVGGEMSTRATACCKSSKDALVSHAVPFPLLEGVRFRLAHFLSLPPSYQDYCNRLIIPFYAVDKNINHFKQMF